MKHLCFSLFICLLGIEYSYGMIQSAQEMQNDCALEGGFCINVIPPPPPRRMRQGRRRGPMGRRGLPKSKTKKGTRSGKPPGRQAGAAGGPGPATGVDPPYQAQQQSWGPPAQQPRQQPNSLFGGFNPMWLFMSTRKKRQAAEPPEQGEIPPIRRGENVMNYLNTHCRSTEFNFSCQRTGGVCCFPPP